MLFREFIVKSKKSLLTGEISWKQKAAQTVVVVFFFGQKQRKIRTLNLANIFCDVRNTDVLWFLMIMNSYFIDSSTWNEIFGELSN